MQVLVGPTYNMEVSASASSPACVSDRSTSSVVPASAAAQGNNKAMSSSCLFFNGYENGDQNTFGSDGDSSSDSSSIGVPGDSEEEEDENDVVSSPRNKFSSMDSLEDSLPNKRGLSNHYSGKSKSFGNLTEMVMSKSTEIKELEKQENPFNKRRRVLIANKWSRKFFYSRHNPKSMPLFPILPEEQEEEEEEEEDQRQAQEQYHDEQLHGNKLKIKMGFKSQSCFCLADLAEEEDDDDEEQD